MKLKDIFKRTRKISVIYNIIHQNNKKNNSIILIDSTRSFRAAMHTLGEYKGSSIVLSFKIK